MIITDIEQLRKVPIGKVVTLIMEFKVVETSLDCTSPCGECVFVSHTCNHCSAGDRFDGKEVKFIKI